MALGCVFAAMQDMGIILDERRSKWVEEVSSRKVDIEDFEEVVEALGIQSYPMTRPA